MKLFSTLCALLLCSKAVAGICIDRAPCGPYPDGYKVYVATMGNPWVEQYDFPAEPPATITTCDDTFNVRDFPGDLVFFVVTAYNSVGESPTEHGDFMGEGYDPGPPCP